MLWRKRKQTKRFPSFPNITFRYNFCYQLDRTYAAVRLKCNLVDVDIFWRFFSTIRSAFWRGISCTFSLFSFHADHCTIIIVPRLWLAVKSNGWVPGLDKFDQLSGQKRCMLKQNDQRDIEIFVNASIERAFAGEEVVSRKALQWKPLFLLRSKIYVHAYMVHAMSC